jgi:hypothetical protein
MAIPPLTCPSCGHTLEHHATIEMQDVGRLDTGYCVRCQRMFERIRETATFYDSSLWPPTCRSCRQPVIFGALLCADADEETVLYRCQGHASEQWVWSRATERWKRTAD